ncbi:MAG: PH domain-containing protein [Actinomycetota bacterium]|uniref:PH domain-containing protein n=1 Tax=Mycobacterium lentiflavum TaxID=141349 RepID=A0ABY3V1H8_MYCLN|nr:PH domain-containing protein [Mycobacterium lentiflavum]MEE3067120.1 PH domain-containing protein [Actinomycetota bacterium]ULP43483.1 PH domain-containing protein [Mycobacterium lentiflavum]
MSEALYEDSGLRLDDDGITIRRYYFPLAGAKRIPYSEIRNIKTEEMTFASGGGRIWGATDPRYWFPLDIRRPRKKKLLILDIGARVHPCITPDDPDRVIELLRDRSPIT